MTLQGGAAHTSLYNWNPWQLIEMSILIRKAWSAAGEPPFLPTSQMRLPVVQRAELE